MFIVLNNHPYINTKKTSINHDSAGLLSSSAACYASSPEPLRSNDILTFFPLSEPADADICEIPVVAQLRLNALSWIANRSQKEGLFSFQISFQAEDEEYLNPSRPQSSAPGRKKIWLKVASATWPSGWEPTPFWLCRELGNLGRTGVTNMGSGSDSDKPKCTAQGRKKDQSVISDPNHVAMEK